MEQLLPIDMCRILYNSLVYNFWN